MGEILEERKLEALALRNEGKIKGRKWKTKMIYSNIGDDYWKWELDNFKGGDKAALGYVKGYCSRLKTMRKKGVGIIFTGTNGNGKTTLQMIILKEAMRRGYSVFYFTMAEIFKWIYLGFEDKKVLRELDNIIKTTDFLAIGELGKDYHRKGSELFMKSEFDMIFRYRCSRHLPTNMDTNLTTDDLEGTYGESLISLFEGSNKMIRVRGADYRRKVKKRKINKMFERIKE